MNENEMNEGASECSEDSDQRRELFIEKVNA